MVAPAVWPVVSDPAALTPVQRVGGLWVKRDDAFYFAGVRGGKVRSCLRLCEGAPGLVTAGSRASPQINIVAHIARALGVPFRAHTTLGALSPEVLAAVAAGAEVVQHPAGYNNVIIARARADAAARGWREVPFGMECPTAVEETRRQAANIPRGVRRVVFPVGSGMSLAGLLHGLDDAGRDIPVLGVVVGSAPDARLGRYAPRDWMVRVEFVPSGLPYHRPAPVCSLGPLFFDPVYEAKCLPFLRPDDLFWAVGVRQSAYPASVLPSDQRVRGPSAPSPRPG